MKIESFEKAKELIEIIKETEKGLEGLKKIEVRGYSEEKHYDDGLYTLHISQYSDGSGSEVGHFCRYLGNVEILNAVIEIVEKQLITYKKMLEEI